MNVSDIKSFNDLTIRGKSRRIREVLIANNSIRVEMYLNKMEKYYITKEESILDDIRNEIVKNRRSYTLKNIDKLF